MKFKATFLTVLGLIILLPYNVYANGHQINIINSSDSKIHYTISGIYVLSGKKTINAGTSQQYKTKLSDSLGVRINSGLCLWKHSRFCDAWLKLCTPETYNADQIASIEFTDKHRCKVTCIDDTNTSCIKL